MGGSRNEDSNSGVCFSLLLFESVSLLRLLDRLELTARAPRGEAGVVARAARLARGHVDTLRTAATFHGCG